jgi:hypothetical protein
MDHEMVTRMETTQRRRKDKAKLVSSFNDEEDVPED